MGTEAPELSDFAKVTYKAEPELSHSGAQVLLHMSRGLPVEDFPDDGESVTIWEGTERD